MMPTMRRRVCGAMACALALGGCAGPLDDRPPPPLRASRALAPPDGRAVPPSAVRDRAAGREAEPLPVLDERAGVEDYVRYAALNNPSVEAAFQRWRASIERLPQVTSLDDPRFRYGYMIRNVGSPLWPDGHEFELMQMFPWLGTLRARGDVAAREADAAWRRFEDALLELSLGVRVALYELHLLDRSVEITRENVELLVRFERTAVARYRVAAADHPDVLRAQVELGAMEDRVRSLEQARPAAEARLNALLNRSDRTPVPPSPPMPDDELTAEAEARLAALVERSPRVREFDDMVERGRAAERLARLDGLPGFEAGVMYARMDKDAMRDAEDSLMLQLTVSLPIWREKYDAGVRQAMAERLAAAHDRQGETNRALADLHEALYQHRDAARRVSLYRDTLIPRAEQSLHASLAGFQAGTSDFLGLLDTERTLLEFRLALERARTERAQAMARIDRLAPRPGAVGEATEADAEQEDRP